MALSPAPLQTPVTDANGLLAAPWSKFFGQSLPSAINFPTFTVLTVPSLQINAALLGFFGATPVPRPEISDLPSVLDALDALGICKKVP